MDYLLWLVVLWLAGRLNSTRIGRWGEIFLLGLFKDLWFGGVLGASSSKYLLVSILFFWLVKRIKLGSANQLKLELD